MIFFTYDQPGFAEGRLPLSPGLLEKTGSACMNLYILKNDSSTAVPLWMPVLEWMPVEVRDGSLRFDPDPQILTWKEEDGASVLRRLRPDAERSLSFYLHQSISCRLFVLKEPYQSPGRDTRRLRIDPDDPLKSSARMAFRKVSELKEETFLYQFILSENLSLYDHRPDGAKQVSSNRQSLDTPCGRLVFTLHDQEATVSGYAGEDEELNIPSVVEGRPVRAIGPAAFRESMAEALDDSRNHLRQIRLPDTIVRIGRCAFENALSLESVRLPRGLKSIEEKAFAGCSLRSLDLPEGLESIGRNAFYMAAPATGSSGSSQLDTLYLPASLCHIGSGAFAGMHFREASAHPDNPAAVIEDGFLLSKDRRLLQAWVGPLQDDVFIPDGVEEIGYSAFEAAYEEDETGTISIGLKRVHLNDGLERIDSFAFYDIPTLEEVVLPDSLKTIGEFAFALSEPTPVQFTMNIPAHLEEMKDYALDLREHVRFENADQLFRLQ